MFSCSRFWIAATGLQLVSGSGGHLAAPSSFKFRQDVFTSALFIFLLLQADKMPVISSRLLSKILLEERLHSHTMLGI